ncbi:MAG: outer membrane lipid asymmetry maintenance protein MlaD [Alphaproteobacteria bacterium]|nr:outer membrane lipid asymmetry maintenance protein MlaD [Alphaproteobacteria bacterium]MDX5368193.1 outer membrane lipid asymmetry maintenance protein MlaD [Alphaproteobacteria bacterium]MDX5463009.1 outer membrane lipid asymmetry maintenance protein MlaD [Alphaproteobacteria bacterium]
MREKLVETLIGALVLAVAVGFFVYAYSRADSEVSGGYALVANFDRADGLTRGTDVRLSGIKIGQVTDQALDRQTYFAKVTISVDPTIEIPADSSIRVASEGLLGGAYLSIEPGAADDMMKPGDEFLHTQGAVDLIGLLGQAVFSAGSKQEEAQ